MAPCHSTCSGTSASAPSSPSLGPSAGGTRRQRHGLEGGSHYVCRFGSHVVPATAVPASSSSAAVSSLRCVAPPWSGTGPAQLIHHRLERHRAPISISLNAQQFHPTSSYYAYHHEPLLESVVTPRHGPAAGGTMVTVRGSHLDGGDERLTRDAGQPAEMWTTQLEDVRTRSRYLCRYSVGDNATVKALPPQILRSSTPSTPPLMQTATWCVAWRRHALPR